MTLGILGGMGPMAGIVFAKRLTELTEAEGDGDYIPFILSSPVSIPPRSDYLVKESRHSPLPRLISEINRLEDAGADRIAVTCNTAHAFLSEMQSQAGVPLYDMVAVTAAASRFHGTCLPILATRGTVKMKLYDAPLAHEGIQAIYPDNSDQDIVDGTINRVKAGNCRPSSAYLSLLTRYSALYGSFVLGCTELSVEADFCREICADAVDPLTELAKAVIVDFGKTVRANDFYLKQYTR